MPIDVLREVFDKDLAADFFPKKRDVGADDRAKIEQQRFLMRP